jgi:hypothetical protein
MSTSHSEFLNHIQKQREELNKLVSLAQDIEFMINGLRGIEQLENISIKIPEEIQGFINPIINTIKDDSSDDIKELLRSLDHQVHTSLRETLNKALIEISRDMDHQEIESKSEQLGENIKTFKEKVHTSIGARIILKQRNIDIPQFKCEIPINTINENIQKLDNKEKSLRVKITDKIDNMVDEISVFLNDDTVPQSMKEMISNTHNLLLTRKQQLQSGENFSDITIEIDTIELETDTLDEESIVIDKEAQIEPVQNEEKEQKKYKKNNILKRVIIWITTPLEISWKDTEYFEKQK